MLKTTDKPSEELSWEALRRKASVIGIPAWKLAEELAFHQKDGQLVFDKPLSN